MDVQKPERPDDDEEVASEGQPEERKGNRESIDDYREGPRPLASGGPHGYENAKKARDDDEGDDEDHTKDQAEDCHNDPWHNQAWISLVRFPNPLAELLEMNNKVFSLFSLGG